MIGYQKKAYDLVHKPLSTKGRIIFHMDSMGGGYGGNSIKYSNSPKKYSSGSILHVVGWKANRPKKGDLLRTTGSSGNVAIGEFIKVELCSDPNDMFFGDVKVIGYDMDYMKKNGIKTEFTQNWKGLVAN